ncbi:MAG TPA: CBS domain-containing protein [Usitatibacter sp.]|nr:CBS domain-containing protein [Usitatibacter sp.]
MKTGDVCKRDVIAIRASGTLAEASKLMREGHVGSIVVVDDADPSRPVGIVTDRDIVVEVVAAGLDPATLTVGEIMGRTLVVAREDDDALASLKTLRRRAVRRLPVVDAAGALVGIVTLDDLLEVGTNALVDVVQAITSGRALESWRRA